MYKKQIVIILVLAFVALMFGAYLLYSRLGQDLAPDQLGTQATGETKPEANPAPDFTVYDAGGNEVKLSDYFGKPIVLNFWASWCGPCKMEMPDFHEKYLELGDEVQFLMVNMTTGRETQETAESFIAEQGYTFPVLFDLDSAAAAAYGAYSLPTTIFIDAEGNGIARATGAIDAETLQKGIDMITKAE